MWDNLKHMCKELTDEECLVLADEYLLTGSLVVRDKLILGNVKLVVGQACVLGKSYPSLLDDFLDIGLLTLVEAVEDFIPRATNNNIRAYLYPRIRGKMFDCIRRKRPVQMSEKHWEKIREQDQVLEVDFFDQFNVVERQCLDLFMVGYNATEIADVLGITSTEMYRSVLPKLRKKLND